MTSVPVANLFMIAMFGTNPVLHPMDAPNPTKRIDCLEHALREGRAITNQGAMSCRDERTQCVRTPHENRSARNRGDADSTAQPTTYTIKKIEGWNIRVDDRLLRTPNEALGTHALRFLEAKLADIKRVVPADKVKKLQRVTIVLDLTNGNLSSMQYHPDSGWLKANGHSPELVKCVHLPRAASVATKRNTNEQPWVILHELAHAYHDQELGFDEPRIKGAYEQYKKSKRGEKTLLFNGKRVKHYALTNHKEFFAEMTESYFGVNDFFPFTQAELKEAEPEIYELMVQIWESAPMKK